MPNQSCLCGLFLTLALGLTQVGVIADEPNPWRVAPPQVKELTSTDREARDELLKLIEKKQDPKYRAEFILEVPERATGVPTTYDLLMYRSHAGFAGAATRIEIQVRGDRATLELCDRHGIWQVNLPAKPIDRHVRQLAYGFQASERDRYGLTAGGGSYATHTPAQTIELVSRDEKSPCHLRTPAWQAIGHDIDQTSHGIRGFVHTRFSDALHKIAYQESKLLAEEAEASEILRRLKSVRAENLDTPTYLREDQSGIEALIYGHLAVERKLAAALPELRRLGREDFATRLEIVTMANPGPRIQRAILDYRNDRHKLYLWAMEFAQDQRHPERLQWLLDLLPKLDNHYHADSILKQAAKAKLSQEQLAQIESFYEQTGIQLAKISAANVLLLKTHDAKYYEYLWAVYRNSPRTDKDDYQSPWQVAAHHLLAYSAQTGKRRETSRALLMAFIAEIPAGTPKAAYPFYGLLKYIGLLGTREDLPLLTEIIEKESADLAGDAIEAMAHIDPKLAMKEVHRRLEHQLATSTDWSDYGRNVSTFFDLILWQRDTKSIPLLKKAWGALEKDRLPWWGEQYDPSPVIEILEAKSPDRRLTLTLAFFQRRYMDEKLLRDIAQRLIDEGADPQKCRPLFQTVAERTRRGR